MIVRDCRVEAAANLGHRGPGKRGELQEPSPSALTAQRGGEAEQVNAAVTAREWEAGRCPWNRARAHRAWAQASMLGPDTAYPFSQENGKNQGIKNLRDDPV